MQIGQLHDRETVEAGGQTRDGLTLPLSEIEWSRWAMVPQSGQRTDALRFPSSPAAGHHHGPGWSRLPTRLGMRTGI